MQSCRCGYATCPWGISGCSTSYFKPQQHRQVGSQCLHSRLRTFRWAPLERFCCFFYGEQKGHGEISHLQNDSKPGKLLRSGLFLGSFPWEMFFGGLGWMNWLGWMSWLGGMRTADFFIVLRNLITFPMFFLIFFAGSFFTFVDIF